VLLIPDFEIKTSAARKVLPRKISRVAALESCQNACAITAAFASRNYRSLRGAFRDHLHQPYRARLVPFLPRVIAAAEKAGALGCLVISIGNLTVGGTGKTPIVEKFARALQSGGRQVAILSRGYKSVPLRPNWLDRLRGKDADLPRVVSDGKSLLLDSLTAG